MSLGMRILAGLILGFLLGNGCADPIGTCGRILLAVEPVGQVWLNALRMTVLPLVLALLVTGVGEDRGQARGAPVAGRSLLWFVAGLTASAIGAAVFVSVGILLWQANIFAIPLCLGLLLFYAPRPTPTADKRSGLPGGRRRPDRSQLSHRGGRCPWPR